jgi:DNA-binding transcriptional LysR family regulator
MVAADLGVALVPHLAYTANPAGVRTLELEDEGVERVVALAWHQERELAPLGATFVDLCVEACAEIGSAGAGVEASPVPVLADRRRARASGGSGSR